MIVMMVTMVIQYAGLKEFGQDRRIQCPEGKCGSSPMCNGETFDAYSLSLTAGTPSISTEGSTPKAPAKRQILTRLGLRCPRSMPPI